MAFIIVAMAPNHHWLMAWPSMTSFSSLLYAMLFNFPYYLLELEARLCKKRKTGRKSSKALIRRCGGDSQSISRSQSDQQDGQHQKQGQLDHPDQGSDGQQPPPHLQGFPEVHGQTHTGHGHGEQGGGQGD